ncbi:Beta-glucosidase 17 [Abeliophyllum distichum]|uniref:Beta-glucosidase 17 n=1 Tax=Abeliophyllum distichum TaxID=126358 RepID=A0ABD1RTK1_9LAMI
MELHDYLFLLLVIISCTVLSVSAENVPSTHISTPLNRTSFPSDFVFGAASSANQYEGAAKEDGRGPSIWDNFTHKYPGKIVDRSNGDIANDFYHRYKFQPKMCPALTYQLHLIGAVFPSDFVFGAASSAYQYEGAIKEDGRSPSIWDTFAHKYPGKILDHSNGDLANDFYHRYKDDVKLMEFIGLNGFRFSISWSRILPHGKLSKGVNKDGIAFYNNLINELLSKGIQPFVTIYHWDLPQALQEEYGGFLSPRIMDDYKDFAEAQRLLDVVLPGRTMTVLLVTPPPNPYIAARFLLLCHARTVKLYREKYKPFQKGQIGIVLVSHWFVPYSKSQADLQAAQRALDFMYGWFLHPITYGDFPKNMHVLVGKRLPKFTLEESKLLKDSYDYLGLNYYTSNYAADLPLSSINTVNISYSTDSQTNLTTERNGKLIGEPTGVSIFYVYPSGLRDLLVYTKQKYKNPTIYIMENGIGDSNITTVKEGINDPQRGNFYRRHLLAILQAIRDGVNVKGIFPWSFLDNYEWGSGYTQKFGLVYVDRTHRLKRYPKKSAFWFKKFLQ